ncbi:MAG TPA: TonB-dependent receptor [Vicinamibacterales bacterium]
MIAAILLTLSLAAAPAASTMSGTVHDSAGGVVQGALVIVRSPGGAERQVVTGPDGRFTIDAPEGAELTVIVRAGGFAETTKQVTASERNGDLDVVVAPAGVLETVTVTPARGEQRVGDVPASVNVLTEEDIKSSPAVVADDVLRQVPTFSLFRRSNSLSTHPTSQGVSLRGIGPSGVSRTLVLLDDVPFNDPFGGWVYWTRVPLEASERIEVVDGPTASLYGNYAMGGVINIVTQHPERRTLDIKPQYGSKNSPKLDFVASDTWNKLGAVVEGSYFDTDGFPIVAASERGPIDINATVKYANTTGKVEYTPSDQMQLFARGGYFSEDRVNGKVGEVNDTRWTSLSGGGRFRLPDDSTLSARVFMDYQRFHSTFMAVSNATTLRNFVRLSVDQHVPTDGVGSMAQWTKIVGTKNVLSAGADWRWVQGDSHEDSYNQATPVTVIPPVTLASVLALQRISGGTQQIGGAFVQDVYTPLPQMTITLSGRVDHWHNYDGHNLETAVIPGTPTNNQPNLPDRSDNAFSPRAALLYHFSDRVSAWGAWSSGFRAPTLNELYRQFRVGTVLTLPNNQLGPERLYGGEAGVNVAVARNLTWRTTWFDNVVNNPVANVTLSTTPSTTTQQRQNLGSTEIWGVQTDVEYRLGTDWRVSAAYLFDHAIVTDGGVANAALVGNYLPQVPKNRGSVQVGYANPKYLSAAIGIQVYGLQFDDDQNIRAVQPAALVEAGYSATHGPGLPGYTTVDITASRTIVRNFDLYFGIQNLFNQEYFVGTLPDTIGTPRLVNFGARVRFAGK